MPGGQNRRDVLIGVAAAGAAMAADAALAQGSIPPPPGGSYIGAGALVANLAARKISSAEAVNAAIARIEALDGKLNAVVVRDFDNARDAAKEADLAIMRGEKKPLLGLPMTVKEAFNVAGLPTTWGVPGAKGRLVGEDAVTVARLKAAGAIILGKTNVPFMLSDWQSYNEIYGTTNNPWNPERTPGGSSGGAAAALAAGFVPLELGSDIGGSLRVPAHFCGVFAHKPTHALVPSRGQTPPGATALPVEVDLAVVGPMARSADDLALALDVLAGPDEPLATAYKLALPPPRHAALKDYRVLVLDTHPLMPTSQAVRAAVERLADLLTRAGAKVARSSPLLPNLPLIASTYQTLLGSFLGADIPIEVYKRMQAAAAGLPTESRDLDVATTRGFVASHRDWIWADRIRNGIAARFRALFKEFDVVVCPIMPTVAFPHDHTEQTKRTIDIDGKPYPYLHQTVWPGVATLAGQPATAVPIGRADNGLPIGVQVVGPYLEDRTTIAFAGLIEREFGGFVPPPGYAG